MESGFKSLVSQSQNQGVNYVTHGPAFKSLPTEQAIIVIITVIAVFIIIIDTRSVLLNQLYVVFLEDFKKNLSSKVVLILLVKLRILQILALSSHFRLCVCLSVRGQASHLTFSPL